MAKVTEQATSQPQNKILGLFSSSLAPYAELTRVHRLLGIYLNTSPYFVGVAFSASIATDLPVAVLLHRLALFSVWSFFLRCAGCVWNDLIDADLDGQIARTKSRPIPLGLVSKWQAVTLGNIGWAIPMTMHSLGVDPLDHLAPTVCMFLFIATVIIMVDVVYACQDTEEDLKVGVRSMAVRFRNSIDILAYSLFYASTALFASAGLLAGLGFPFLVVSVGGHFFGFSNLLKATHVGKSSGVEKSAKSYCFLSSILWVFGLGIEYCVRGK
ncbi:unnamed protein product [Penicillium bialowiezense]